MTTKIVGIGMHRFGRTDGVSGREQGALAARRALEDAGIGWRDVQFAVGGSADAGWADSLVNELGLTGLPFLNVTNGCATGASVLQTASALIESGRYDVGMAVGFDKHPRGAFRMNPEEWGLGSWYGETGLALTTQFFATKIKRYMHDYQIGDDALVRVAEKNFRNGAKNPMSWRRQALSYEEIAGSAMVSDPLRKYMFCSPAEGAVALILCSESAAKRFDPPAITLASVAFATRSYGTFEVLSPCLAPTITESPTAFASREAFETAGVAPSDVALAQLQDTDSGSEIMHMAECGFCAHGEQERMIASGETEISGRLPINTDGGCMANGEPVGASGLRQIYENALQLRGEAGPRQVGGNPMVAFSQVYGAPGIGAAAILTR